MPFRNKRAANSLGFVSLFLCTAPLLYALRLYPETSSTEAIILIGGALGSLVTALGAGFLGSRWWFAGALGSVLDVVCILRVSP
jgi:hypothetical protein